MQTRVTLAKAMTPRRSPQRADPTNRAAFIPRHRDSLAFTGPVDESKALAKKMDAVVIVFETAAEAEAHCDKVNASRTGLRAQSNPRKAG